MFAAPDMFATLIKLITGEPPPEEEHNLFVQEVRVRHREPRSCRMEWFIFVAWILIGLKHAAVLWACARYPVPFDPIWINLPTWLLGVLATGIYYARTRSARKRGPGA